MKRSAPFKPAGEGGDLVVARYCDTETAETSEDTEGVGIMFRVAEQPLRLPGMKPIAIGADTFDNLDQGDPHWDYSLEGMEFDDLMKIRYSRYVYLQTLYEQYAAKDKSAVENGPGQPAGIPTLGNLKEFLDTHSEEEVLNWTWREICTPRGSTDFVEIAAILKYFACQPDLREYFCFLEFEVLVKRASKWSQQRALAVDPLQRKSPPTIPKFLENNNPEKAKRILIVDKKVIDEINKIFTRSASLSLDSDDEEVDLAVLIEQIKQVPALMECLRMKIVRAQDLGTDLTLDQILQDALKKAQNNSPSGRPKMKRKEFFELFTDQDILETSPESTMKIVEQRFKQIYQKLSCDGLRPVTRSELLRAIQNDKVISRRKSMLLMPKHLTHDYFQETTVEDLVGQLTMNLPEVMDKQGFIHSVRKSLIRPGKIYQTRQEEFQINDDDMFPDYMRLLSPRKPSNPKGKPQFKFPIPPEAPKPPPEPEAKQEPPSPPEPYQPKPSPAPETPSKPASLASLPDITPVIPTDPQPGAPPPPKFASTPRPLPPPVVPPPASILAPVPVSTLSPEVVSFIRQIFVHTPAILAAYRTQQQRKLAANVVRRVAEYKPLTREQLAKSKEKLKEQQAASLLAHRLREGVEKSLRESSRGRDTQSSFWGLDKVSAWNSHRSDANSSTLRSSGDPDKDKKAKLVELVRTDRSLSKDNPLNAKNWAKSLSPYDKALLAEGRVLYSQGKLL